MECEGSTRATLCEAVAEKDPFITKTLARSILDAMLEEIAAALVNSETVKLRNFGTFTVRDKRERLGRNPRTMEPAKITARRSLRFKASPAVVKKINATRGSGD
jgi:integration host factor subunit alpha